jgi:hypothetical protein
MFLPNVTVLVEQYTLTEPETIIRLCKFEFSMAHGISSNEALVEALPNIVILCHDDSTRKIKIQKK